MSKARKDVGATVPAAKRKIEEESEKSTKRRRKRGSSQKAKDAESTSATPRPSSGPAQSRPIDHDENIAMRDPALLADFFAQKVAKHYSDSSSIEQQDLSIAKSWIQDTTDFDQIHVANNLPVFLEKFASGGKDALSTCSTEAAPHTLVIASSGIRVADLVRELRVYNTKDSKVGKFIAKHMKLKENIEYLAKTRVGIAVATPARLKDLVEQEALKTDNLITIVIDSSYLDEKKRALTDMADVFQPLLNLMHHEKVKARLEADDGAKLLVF